MAAANPESPKTKRHLANGAVYAINLALLLDGRRTGLTFDEIRRSGVLGDEATSLDTVKHRFSRARSHLSKMGIVITSDSRGSDKRLRYRLASDVTFAEKTQVELSADETMRLASLIVCCVRSSIPFSGDLRDAGRRIMSIAGQTNALHSIANVDVPQASSPAQMEEKIASLATQARDERRPLTFSYVKAGGKANEARTVDVYDVCLRLGHVYIVGYDVGRSGMRTFRADRVQQSPTPSIDNGRPAYAIPDDFDAHDYFRLPFQYAGTDASTQSTAHDANGSDDIRLTFEALRPMSEAVRARATQGQGTWSDDDATWTVSCQNEEAALFWATESLANGDMRLIEPQILLSKIKNRLEKVVDIHG